MISWRGKSCRRTPKRPSRAWSPSDLRERFTGFNSRTALKALALTQRQIRGHACPLIICLVSKHYLAASAGRHSFAVATPPYRLPARGVERRPTVIAPVATGPLSSHILWEPDSQEGQPYAGRRSRGVQFRARGNGGHAARKRAQLRGRSDRAARRRDRS